MNKTFAKLLTFALLLGAVLVPDAFAGVRDTNLYWAPECVTVGGQRVDSLLNFIFYLTGAVFLLTQAVYIYYLVKYRKRPGSRAYYSHGNNKLEIIWTAIPTAIFIGLVIYSNRLWSELHSEPPADSVRVDIVGYQFGWDMRYPGADGKLGKVDTKLYSTENKFALVPDDPAGADDFSSTELVVPVGKPVHIYLHSRDVIHSFYVPEFRLYQAAVPGRTIAWVWFETTKTGDFQLACSQISGSGHYNMTAPIRVATPAECDTGPAGKSAAKAAEAQSASTTASPPLVAQRNEGEQQP
ncbi:MAG: cytochrome c oxidase subunit II [Chthoniobacterales bacterium]